MTANNKNADQNRKKLRELIEDIEVAMLVTLTGNGMLHGRPMATRLAEDNDNLWFFTDKDSTKVFEIEGERQVNVSYARPESNRYVSVSGTASVVNDRQMIDKLWTPMARVWFPDGKSDTRLTLIKVMPIMAEYWDEPAGAFASLYELTKSVVTGERINKEFADNEKVDMRQ